MGGIVWRIPLLSEVKQSTSTELRQWARIAVALSALLLAACSAEPLPVTEPTAVATLPPQAVAQTVTSTSAKPLSHPVAAAAVAVSPDGRIVVAVNPDSDSITLVDTITLTVLAEIPVGDNPRTVSLTPDSKTALVANQDSTTISKVDLIQAVEIAWKLQQRFMYAARH